MEAHYDHYRMICPAKIAQQWESRGGKKVARSPEESETVNQLIDFAQLDA